MPAMPPSMQTAGPLWPEECLGLRCSAGTYRGWWEMSKQVINYVSTTSFWFTFRSFLGVHLPFELVMVCVCYCRFSDFHLFLPGHTMSSMCMCSTLQEVQSQNGLYLDVFGIERFHFFSLTCTKNGKKHHLQKQHFW